MADISQELSAIKNSVYGKNMRTAIHDAIKKVNEDGDHGIVTNVLWTSTEGATVGTEYTMSDDINNYDIIWLKIGNPEDIFANKDYTQFSFLPSLVNDGERVSVENMYFKRYMGIRFSNAHFTVEVSTATDESIARTPVLYQIVGVKF